MVALLLQLNIKQFVANQNITYVFNFKYHLTFIALFKLRCIFIKNAYGILYNLIVFYLDQYKMALRFSVLKFILSILK